MSLEGCCRSFCDGCPWAEEQKEKLLNKDKKSDAPNTGSDSDSSDNQAS